MALDTSEDYLVWENREAVTFRSRTRTGGTDFPITDAKRRAPTYKELAASNGAYTGQDLVWLLPAVLAPSASGQHAPKPGDKVTDDDGVIWTALEVALNKLKQTWRLVTRNLVLAYDLRDTIDIQRPTISYDAAGAITRTWPDDETPGGSNAYEGLAAKVQLITDETVDILGVRGLKGNYAVFVAEDVEIQESDRIKWDGVYLTIKTLRNPQRIDELPVLDCELLP